MDTGIVSNWSRTRPPIPWVIVIITCISLLTKLAYTLLTPLQQQIMMEAAGASPAGVSLMLALPLRDWPGNGLGELVTTLFIHSDWLHLLGNLAYLWVFGVKVEQKLGNVFFLILFLLGGVLAQVMVAIRLPELDALIIGSSGAVSAVVGAYLGLFPASRIGLFLPLGLYLQFARVPALLVIGSWFTLQLVYSAIGPITGTAAWWIHLAGFALGLIMALLAHALGQLRFGPQL